MTTHSSTNETPFRLTFDMKVVIPIEIGESSPRTALFQPGLNEEELRANLDLLQETREVAQIREYMIKARVAKQQGRRLSPRQFKSHDLVLRKITRIADNNKLTPIWKGPFKVSEEVGNGAYRLEHLDGKRIPRTWNTLNLRFIFAVKHSCETCKRPAKKAGPRQKTRLRLANKAGPGQKTRPVRGRPTKMIQGKKRPVRSRPFRLVLGNQRSKTYEWLVHRPSRRDN
ncbi:hypothetical protein CR513_11315, partial [Mucuna pruriens]